MWKLEILLGLLVGWKVDCISDGVEDKILAAARAASERFLKQSKAEQIAVSITDKTKKANIFTTHSSRMVTARSTVHFGRVPPNASQGSWKNLTESL